LRRARSPVPPKTVKSQASGREDAVVVGDMPATVRRVRPNIKHCYVFSRLK
jgi:hypothetical protein